MDNTERADLLKTLEMVETMGGESMIHCPSLDAMRALLAASVEGEFKRHATEQNARKYLTDEIRQTFEEHAGAQHLVWRVSFGFPGRYRRLVARTPAEPVLQRLASERFLDQLATAVERAGEVYTGPPPGWRYATDEESAALQAQQPQEVAP